MKAVSSTTPSCLICKGTADSVHFGALSCRACAAFFRRKVAANQKIRKKCEGFCPMNHQVWRRFCAFCRFEKCLKSGMKSSLVLAKPINYIPSTSSFVFLTSLQEFYGRLLKARNETYYREEGPKITNYQGVRDEHFIDERLIIDNLIPFFHWKAPMLAEQQTILDRQFFVPYVLLERAFESQNGEIFVMASGDLVDITDLTKFYQGPGDYDEYKVEEARSVMEPYWKLNDKVLRQCLREVKLDLEEFLFLVALIYWDFGLSGQTDECMETCKSMRSHIMSELTSYEKERRKLIEDSMRVGEVMMVLQTLQKSLSIMLECREISQVYDLNGRACPLFENM